MENIKLKRLFTFNRHGLAENRLGILPYDTKEWPFKETIEKCLLEDDLTNLDNGYELLDREHDQSTKWHTRFYANNKNFLNLYYEFLVAIVQPEVGERIVYQKVPTFRVQLRNNVAVGEFHKDRDYGHTQGTNFWMPFIDTNEANTVWIENQPQIVKYGEILIFDSLNLSHGNKVNTSDKTRVSVDFRIIPLSQYVESDKESINTKTKFKIGGYYEVL